MFHNALLGLLFGLHVGVDVLHVVKVFKTLLQGICSLIKGQKAEDVIARLKGIECGSKGTSCPDQLAIALEEAIGR